MRFCYDCQPGGPHTPPPCRRCGSTAGYFSAGLCIWCHRGAPYFVDACRDCHAWGVTRTHTWLCKPCIAWRNHNPTVGPCLVCRQSGPISARLVCRLCWREAANAREATKRERPYRPLDVVGANRNGQQLFFANMGRRRGARSCSAPPPPIGRRRRAGHQLGLFDAQPETWASRWGLPEPPRTERTDAFDALVREHAARHGWSRNTTKRTRRVVRVLVSRQRHPAEPIRASEVLRLADMGNTARPVLTFLSEASLLEDDRVPATVTWFERQVAALAPTMVAELRQWFDVLRLGSSVPPRSRPRADVTIRTRTLWALPVLESWTASGRQSLREISRADVVAALPASGTPRATTGAALRSIFRTLKAHKVVFTNPTARIPTGGVQRRQPLPLDVDTLRSAIHADDPARAALGALLAFHGLRHEQLRRLQLTDIRDGRLHLEHSAVLLADPVRERLSAWLDHRNRRWPNTANPHFFIHYRTATATGPIGHTWIGRTLGVAPGAFRDDRILDEVAATGGDIRRLCDLFGLSVSAAVRYVATLDHPELVG